MSGNERRNRKVFRWCWNDCRVDTLTTFCGSVLQMEEAAAEKARLPKMESSTDGTIRYRRPSRCVSSMLSRNSSRLVLVVVVVVMVVFRRPTNSVKALKANVARVYHTSNSWRCRYRGNTRRPAVRRKQPRARRCRWRDKTNGSRRRMLQLMARWKSIRSKGKTNPAPFRQVSCLSFYHFHNEYMHLF